MSKVDLTTGLSEKEMELLEMIEERGAKLLPRFGETVLAVTSASVDRYRDASAPRKKPSHVIVEKDVTLLKFLKEAEVPMTRKTRGGYVELPIDLADDLARRKKAYDMEVVRMTEAEKEKAFAVWADGTGTLEGEHGTLYLPNPTLDLLYWAAKGCNHTILLGEPGVGKTDVTRALAKVGGFAHYHLDVTGMSDVSQLEAERFIESKDGVAVTTFRSSALIRALEAAGRGVMVMLDIQEIARVQDMSILNPLFHLMSHGEYPCTVTGITYKPEKNKFWIVASANVDPRFNFAGNSRRGIDDGLLDRFLAVTLERPSNAVAAQVIANRGYAGNYTKLWGLASAKSEYAQVVTFRRLLEIAKVCTELGWSQPFAASELLAPRFKVTAHHTAFIAAVEGLGI
jgi:MoxR-like ATPase